MDSKVFLPIIIVCPFVNALTLCRSSGIFHGSCPFFPIPLLLSIAAIIDIFILKLYHTTETKMIVKAFKTKKIVVGDDLYKILNEYLPTLEEKSVVAIT